MIARHQTRRRLSPVAEPLEGRALLSAVHHLHGSMAHLSSVPSSIRVTLAGTATFVSPPTNALVGTDAYNNLTGSVPKWGKITVNGTDAFSSFQLNATTDYSAYYFGNWTMTLANGNEIAIEYQGAGPYPANPGTASIPYSFKLSGKAVVISGADLGHTYSVAGQANGDDASGAFAVKLSLKS